MTGIEAARSGLFILGALAVTAASGPAEATVVKAMSLLEKTEVAPVIVHGVVKRVSSEWEVFGARVQTNVTIQISETIKGDLQKGAFVTFRRPGGTVDKFSQMAPGLATYEVGEEVIMFLEPYGAQLVAIGIGIGKYRVETDGANKWVTHAPQVAGMRFDSPHPQRIEPIPEMEPELLRAFMKRLRSFARGIPTRRPVLPRKGAVIDVKKARITPQQ